MINKKWLLYIFLLFIILSQSCIKDKLDFDKLSKNTPYNPNWAIPVVNSRLTFRDIIRDFNYDHLFESNQDGFLTLIYTKKIKSISGASLVQLPVITVPQMYDYNDYNSAGGFNPNSCVFAPKNISISITPTNGEQFDSLIIKNTQLDIDVNSSFLHDGTLKVTFPGIKKNGIAYSKSIIITGSSNNPFHSLSSYQDLTGYTFDLSNPSPNMMDVKYELTLNKTAGNAVNNTDNITIAVTFNGMTFSRMYGNIGQRTIHITDDTVNVEIFNNAFNGSAYFKKATCRFFLTNSYGIPMEATFGNIKAFSTITNLTTSFPPPNPNVKCIAPSNTYIPTSDSIVLDTISYPLIRDIISSSPKYIISGVNIIANPPNAPCYVSNNNFLDDTSKFDVDMQLELPLYAKANLLVLQDTTPYDFSKIFNDVSKIDWVNVRLNIDNGMPVDVKLQMYLTDSNFNVIITGVDSTDLLVAPHAIVNSNGIVTNKTHKSMDVMIPNSKIQRLKDVRYILYRGKISTPDDGTRYVKFFNYNAIDIKAGIKVQFKASLNDVFPTDTTK